MFNRRVERAAEACSKEEKVSRKISVNDCRGKNQQQTEFILETRGLDFNGFLQLLRQVFRIHAHETFVLVTTDRTVLDFDRFEELQDGSTLNLFQGKAQAQSAAMEERITFEPHYDTLIRSGMEEYYSSQGEKPLPYALAELIDNALSATAKNTGARTIEIQMVFDENVGKPAVIVLDNGCGMTSKQLKNWAVYRLSKFIRENGSFGSEQEDYVRPDPVPRSLNSDISYFGVGGKQAIFYIGDSVRMITKPVGSPDVHELVLSKAEFKRKEQNKEEIYSTNIRHRKPGDSSHVNKADERFLHTLIAEERGKESFTAVVISGVFPEHFIFLRREFEVWTRQLAHIYHYYIHGVNGNDLRNSSTNSDHLPTIDILISLREKPPRCPRTINLREVDNDMQTLYISSAVDTFEFKAEQNGGMIDGVIRYHPFLYDRETYPQDPYAEQASSDDNENNESGDVQQAREKRPIFQCFWNGRLIPYTTVAEFDWCTPSKGAKEIPECYSRISGVLFTDDNFKVSTNKLTFMDLEQKLKNKDTIFIHVVNGQKQRSHIQKEFTQWLRKCHENWDKQIEYRGYKETITRTDLPKKVQYPWATFSSIEWDGKIYKKGQLVKTQKTQPIMYGSVVRFLLYGKHDGDIFATGGQVELALEPKAFHDTIKTIPIFKIDKTASNEAIKKHIDNDFARLPVTLKVNWPNDEQWPNNAVRPAGSIIGDLQIQILNKKGEPITVFPSVGQGTGKKLSIVLKVTHHGPKGNQDVMCYVAPPSAHWGYCSNYVELTQLGKYTLSLLTIIKESDATSFGGKELPSYKLNFTVTEGSAETFVMGTVSPTARIGVPFNIPLLIKDGYDHSVTPPPDLQPELKCSGLDLSYETVDSSGTTLTIKGVKAIAKVRNYQQSKTFDVEVTVPGLKNTGTFKISLLPGNPHFLHVTPEENPLSVENGNSVTFNVEIRDVGGNITANPRQTVRCQITGFPPVTADCSTTGAGQLVTKPIDLKIVMGEPQYLKVHFDMPSQKKVELVMRELKVVPGTRVARMELCSEDESLVLRNNEKIEWLAGGLMENLFYKLYDEANREVPPSAEIASKIKVNWTGDLNLEDLVQGKLPDIQVPTQVQVQAERFYQVAYQDQSVSVSFSIVPHPDIPARLKATLIQSAVKLGEILPGNINLELMDQYDNVTKMLTPTCMNHMTVEAEGLDKSSIVFKWQDFSKSVLVTGVRFQSGTPGRREICFSYKTFVERVMVKVTAGVPAELKLVSGPKQPLQVLNDKGIPTPFVVQLCDEWGNPCQDKRVVVELKSSPLSLKVTTAAISKPVNEEGKASFTVNSLSGPKGYYQLDFKGSLNQKPIPGPSVNLTVIPDPTKPVSLTVEYNTKATFPAGGIFPVFLVTVVSDEGSLITTFNPAAVSMFLWEVTQEERTPPKSATELKCSKPLEMERKDCFYFRDKNIPEQVGRYIIQFSLRIDKAKVLYSKQILINVLANRPDRLGPDLRPTAPVVFYSNAIAQRTLVENMTLRIMDSHGNPAGKELNGNVVVTIRNTTGDHNKRLPLFEDQTNSLEISLVQGKAHIPRLAIMENSPGEHGSEYMLVFTPEVFLTPLAPFELSFRFYNDAENQQKMAELSRKKDKLIADVAACKDILTANTELHQMLKDLKNSASQKEAALRKELLGRNMRTGQTIPEIERLMREKRIEFDMIRNQPRRVCSIPDHFRGQQDVLGKVGHLAFVQDDDAARVISWHIRADMDCVITTTDTAAKRIFHSTQGRQQVMPLDGVYVKPGASSLPHRRDGGMLFNPPGNPVLATDLLIYTGDDESCKKAFKNILGDTIVIDDLDSATTYRKMVTQHKMFCPTILTRQGDRVSGKGKYGGTQNKAPPMNALQVFGAPLPQRYDALCKHLELLGEHRRALQKRDETAKELEDHLTNMRSPEMLQKEEEKKEKEKQLEEIERQLASERPVKRGLEAAGEPSGIMSKRAKQ
ncbi:structural maintenance of chromosomes flexible hinge domain-containing protein 1 [Plectropomus leopardus]|uniref:structural maintenance of chromosomes flexible hinge domain-containing protein 1 n=1 Tax=Plectropomus leopardus TaxID=160734 RepID=UPI001C4CF3F0|nr:structural maintenance of chromosomes flexible hinge domain-containing protein 1 [Plectropomus leopardus]